ncbi:MAG: PAS domain-containing protein [Bacteroidetes bacterium]|nr:PAS domain-containing protein [Bacteroidota bacterium]
MAIPHHTEATVTRTTAVRLGVPTGSLARRILLPAALFVFVMAATLSVWQFERVSARLAAEQRSSVRTVFETNPAVLNGTGGLATLARNRGFDRVWVLSATGDILDSNRSQEVGQPLDARWWGVLKEMPSGLHQEEVAFGDQQLLVVSLKAADLGRQGALVSRPIRPGWRWLLNVVGILGVSLMLWGLLAFWVRSTLKSRIDTPTRHLDDRTLDLVRGGRVSEATLDRLHAEVQSPLGGHADCVVDMARVLMRSSRRVDELSQQWKSLFDALPAPACIIDPSHRILQCNQPLAAWLSVEPSWFVGRDIGMLGARIPAERLRLWLEDPTLAGVGVRRLRWSYQEKDGPVQDVLLSVSPMPWGSGSAHLVLIEPVPAGSTPAEAAEPADTEDFEAPTMIDDAPDDPQTTAGRSRSVVGKRRRSRSVATPSPEADNAMVKSAVDDPSRPGREPSARLADPAKRVLQPQDSIAGDGATHDHAILDLAPTPDGLAAHPAASDALEALDLLPARILEATGCAAVVFDEEARTLYWSDAMAALTGRKTGEIADLAAFTRLVLPHDKERELFRRWIAPNP